MLQLRFDPGCEVMFDLQAHLDAAHQRLYDELQKAGLGDWGDTLRASQASRLIQSGNGHLPGWCEALDKLPTVQECSVRANDGVVQFDADLDLDQAAIEKALQTFHPWRKGPFSLFGVQIDSEWRSDWKWNRLAAQLDFADKTILDVGCGNGYYGWRMLEAGARCVIGLEPYPLYNLQHAVFRGYQMKMRNDVVAAGDDVLDARLQYFDVVLSMGVLYHARNAIGHLESLFHSLKSGGTALVETLVVEGNAETVLVPEDRYAKMRNVWMIPSIGLLERLIRRAGFQSVDVLDVTLTTPREQRRTDWMRFESLSDFLDPLDESRTIEGHPAPIRAMVVASKR